MISVLPLRGGEAVQQGLRPVADHHFRRIALEEVDGGALVEIFLGVFQQSEILDFIKIRG